MHLLTLHQPRLLFLAGVHECITDTSWAWIQSCRKLHCLNHYMMCVIQMCLFISSRLCHPNCRLLFCVYGVGVSLPVSVWSKLLLPSNDSLASITGSSISWFGFLFYNNKLFFMLKLDAHQNNFNNLVFLQSEAPFIYNVHFPWSLIMVKNVPECKNIALNLLQGNVPFDTKQYIIGV